MELTLHTPLGPLTLEAKGDFLSRLKFGYGSNVRAPFKGILREAALQLKEYFEGCRKEFDLPLYLEGTEFQNLFGTH